MTASFAATAEEPTTTAANTPHAATAIATDRISILYRRDTDQSAVRLDPAVQAATAAIEREFLRAKYHVVQPSADVYRVLDQGPTVIVTFAPDAGLSLVFSIYQNMRPTPGTDIAIAEVDIDARVFVGRSVLSVEHGRGQVQTRIDPSLREYATRRGYEVAAQKAAATLVPQIVQNLAGLTTEQLTAYAAVQSGSATGEKVGGDNVQSTAPTNTPPTASPAPSQVAPTPTAAPSPIPAPPSATVDQSLLALQPPQDRWAIIAGVSDYSSVRSVKASNLEGVKVDVANMRDVLLRRGFSRDHIRVMQDADATSRNLRGELKRLAGVTRPGDLVVLFSSAHGGNKNFSASGFGMPILSDFSHSNDDLDFWELQSLTRNLPAKQVVWIIDTCHAGGATTMLPTVVMSSNGISLDRTNGRPDVDTIRASMASDHHFAVMTAARADESSLDLGPRGGLFTLHFVDSLTKERNGTTLETLFRDQVVDQVIRHSQELCNRSPGCNAQQQTPVFGYSGSGNKIQL